MIYILQYHFCFKITKKLQKKKFNTDVTWYLGTSVDITAVGDKIKEN